MNPSIDLEAAKAAFFASGRTMLVVEHGDYVPPPARREPAPKPQRNRSKGEIRSAMRLERLEKVKTLAQTMTCAEAMAHTGLSCTCLWKYAADGKFRFRPDPNRGKGNLGKKLSDPDQDRANAEQIIAYRNLQLSRGQTAKLMGISYKQLVRLLEDFDIEYPTTQQRKEARLA